MVLLIAKSILLYIYIFLNSLFTGKFLSVIIKKQTDYKENLVIGFISNIAIIQLMLWPFVAFRLKMIGFIIFFILLTIIPSILGAYFYFKEYKNYKEENKVKTDKKQLILKLIFIGITILQIVLTALFYRSDADDSFYVSNSTLFKDSVNINEYDSSFGDTSLSTVPMYDFQVWETMISVYGFIFNIEPVIIAHTLLIPILIILTNIANYVLGEKLLKDKNKAYIFSIIIMIFNLFGGYSTYTVGSRLLSRIWQGKSIYLCVVLPILIAYILDSIEKLDKNLYLELLICNLAGIGLNPTSLFILGFETLFLIVAISIKKKSVKYIIHMIPSTIAIALFTIMIYIRTNQYSAQVSAASTITYSQIWHIIKVFFSGYSAIYVILYVLASILIIKKGTIEQKTYLIYAPLLMFIFVWNPISGKVVAENVTKVATFWRVYWLIPVAQGIIVGMLLLLDIIKNKYAKYSFVFASILVICLCGKWLISYENGYILTNNIEKLPDETIRFGNIISNYNVDKSVIAMEGVNTTLRQKYNNVKLLFSRNQYVLDLIAYRGNTESANERIKLQNIIDGNDNDFSSLNELLTKYDVGWIIMKDTNQELITALESYGYEVEDRLNENMLLKYSNI